MYPLPRFPLWGWMTINHTPCMTHDPSAGRGASLGAAEILRRAVQGQPCPIKCWLEAHHTLVNTNTMTYIYIYTYMFIYIYIYIFIYLFIYIYTQKNLMANGCSSPNKRWPSSYYCNMYLINPRSCWGLPNAPVHLWYWRPGCFGERCVQKLRDSVTISVIAAGFQPSWTALGRAGEWLQLCDFPGVGGWRRGQRRGNSCQFQELPKLVRARPIRDGHTLWMSWQLPPQMRHYQRSLP